MNSELRSVIVNSVVGTIVAAVTLRVFKRIVGE